MGFIGNIILAGLAGRHNRRANHVSRRLLGFVPENENLIVCGGNTGERGELATSIKEDALYAGVYDAMKKGIPTICICSPNSISQELVDELKALAQGDPKTGNNIVFWGVNVSYMPFDKTTSYEQTCEMFARIIEKYAGQTMNCQNITSLMYVLLSILEDGLGRENFTYYNLSIIVDHLVRTSGSRRGSIEAKNLKEFLSWIEQELHIDAEGFIENSLLLQWDSVVTEFYRFWIRYSAEVNKLSCKNGKKRSLYSCLKKHEVCIAMIAPEYEQLLMETLLNELKLFQETSSLQYQMIGYNISATGFGCYRLTETGKSVFIGNTFGELNIKDCNIPASTVVCLGVSGRDASDIFDMMVMNSSWIQTHLGVGHGGHVGFTIGHQVTITADRLSLMNIRDGSGFILSPNGYTHVNQLYM